MPTEITIRFNLSGNKINRIFKNTDRPTGSQQLVAIISFFPPIKIEFFPDNTRWWVDKNKKHSGYLSYGYGDIGLTPEQRDMLRSKGKRFRSYKVNVNGELLKYERIKFNTGLYILKEAWDTKNQIALIPYEYVNNELAKIKHVIQNTFNELIQFADFSKEKMHSTVKERIKNGMPLNIVVPMNKSITHGKAFDIISKEFKKHEGIHLPDENNPKGVPEDLRDFIPFYHANRYKKKLRPGTMDVHNQFKKKLQRWYEATGGKTLTITGSDIEDVAAFLNWRTTDNEENNIRDSKKIKSKSQIAKIKPEAIGVGTLNKTKKAIIYFYNRAIENYSCRVKFSTKNEFLEEQKYDREMADIYLSMDQILEILRLPIEKDSRIEKHRILFILGCLGGGYRISDLIKLPKPELAKFDDGLEYYSFHVKSTKTNTKTMAPIPPQLNYLIQSYPFGEEIIQQDFRDDIKTIGKLCGWTNEYCYEIKLADDSPKKIKKLYYEMMMPKTCRKTYCSLLYNFWRLSIKECMDFSGHASEEEFKKYLFIDKKIKAQRLVDQFKVKPIFVSV